MALVRFLLEHNNNLTVLNISVTNWLLFISKNFFKIIKNNEKNQNPNTFQLPNDKNHVLVYWFQVIFMYIFVVILFTCFTYMYGPIKYMIKFYKGIFICFDHINFLWHQKAFIKSLSYLHVLLEDREELVTRNNFSISTKICLQTYSTFIID